MKSVLAIPILLFLFLPLSLNSQPTLTLPELELNHIIGAEYSVTVKDFTDISKMELVFTYDGNTISTPDQLFFYPNNNFGVSWEKIIYTDSVKIIMTAMEGSSLTLPDGQNLYIGDFSFIEEACNQAAAIKISNSSKIYRRVGIQEIKIGYFPREGFFAIKCPESTFPRFAKKLSICEGSNFENYTIAGKYVDVFQTQSGQDSIHIFQLCLDTFASITCLSNDTIIIPTGFTNIALKAPDINRTGQSIIPVVNPHTCSFEIESIQTGVPSNKNIFGLGSTSFSHTFKNQTIEESCSYTVHVKEGSVTEKLPSFSMSDISVEEGTSFCIDITTTNFQEIIGFTLFTNWDSTAFEYIETTFPLVYDDRAPIYNFRSPNLVIFNWLTSNFSNGHSIPDNTVVYSVCFKAKKTGQFPINFFSPTHLDLSYNEIIINKENSGGFSEMWLKNATVSVTEKADCNVNNTMITFQICQGENYILNNQAYNQSGNYETSFTTVNGCDSIVELALEVLSVPTAIADTFTTKENENLIFDIAQNDIIPTGLNWQTAIINPPHIGTLTNLGNGEFFYKPRIAYTGTTSFDYQICNELCLPEGCTTAKVILNIEGEQLEIENNPFPIPPTNISETSKIQFPDKRTQEGELFIFNIWGQQVAKKHFFQDSQQQLNNLQQHELPAGIYFYVKKSSNRQAIIESGKIVAIGR